MSRTLQVALVALFSLSLGACNVFEGLAGETELSSSVDVLLSDGQRAIEKGESAEAVRIFTRAVDVTSATRYEGRIARIKLASAKLQAQRISVLDLQEVATGMVAGLDDVPSTPRTGLGLGPVCSFAAPAVAYDLIDLNAVPGYADLRRNTATLAEVRTLIQEALGLSAVATRAQIEAGLSSLRAEGADDLVLAEALADGALANVGVAYDAIVAAGDERAIQWAKVKAPGETVVYLGYCTDSQASLNDLRTRTSGQIDVIAAAVDMVDLRAGLSLFARDSVSKELVREAQEALDRLRRELGSAFAG